MLPSSAKELCKNLLDTISQFKSPAYKSFFERKVNEDYKELQKVSNLSLIHI